MLDIFNLSWKTGHVPQIWREANMIPIHKKGKDKLKTSSYRPISLKSCVGKVMERRINTRLMRHLETNNLIAKEQAGFRQNRSTEDQAAYFAQKVEDGFQEKQDTLAVWIDMEKAFDKVWKDGLRLKLRKNGISGCMYRWLSQYLENRKARVQLNGATVERKHWEKELPKVASSAQHCFWYTSMTLWRTCTPEYKERCMQMIWSCGAQRKASMWQRTEYNKHLMFCASGQKDGWSD